MRKLFFEGDARSFGKAHGCEVKDVLPGILERSQKTEITDEMRKVMDQAVEDIARIAPELIEEMEGLAEGSGLPYQTILRRNLANTLSIFNKPSEKGSGCTSLAFIDTDRGPLMAKNTDCGGPAEVYRFINIMYRPRKGYAFIGPTHMGMFMAPGALNEKGLAVGGSSVFVENGRYDRGALDIGMFGRLAMQGCATVKDAEKLYLEHEWVRGSAGSMLLVDKNGDSAVFEIGGDKKAVIRISSNLLFTSNLFTSGKNQCSLMNGMLGDNIMDRWNFMSSLKPAGPQWTLQEIRELMRSHAQKGALCQHADKNIMATTFSHIAICGEGKFMLTDGNPCKGEYEQFTL